MGSVLSVGEELESHVSGNGSKMPISGTGIDRYRNIGHWCDNSFKLCYFDKWKALTCLGQKHGPFSTHLWHPSLPLIHQSPRSSVRLDMQLPIPLSRFPGPTSLPIMPQNLPLSLMPYFPIPPFPAPSFPKALLEAQLSNLHPSQLHSHQPSSSTTK